MIDKDIYFSFEEVSDDFFRLTTSFNYDEIPIIMRNIIEITKRINYFDFFKIKLFELNLLSTNKLIELKDFYYNIKNRLNENEKNMRLLLISLDEYNYSIKEYINKLKTLKDKIREKEKKTDEMKYLFSYVETIQIPSLEILFNNNVLVIKKIHELIEKKSRLLQQQIDFFILTINEQNYNNISVKMNDFIKTSNELRKNANEII